MAAALSSPLAAALASAPLSTVLISIECTGLPNLDAFSASDPCAVLYMAHGAEATNFVEVGRTEVIQNNNSPRFAQTISVNYYFESVQRCRLIVYDIDKPGAPMAQQELVGELSFTLANVVSARGRTLRGTLTAAGRPNAGQVGVHADESSGMNTLLRLQFAAKNCDKKDLLGKSDPYFEICAANHDGSELLCYRSPVIKKTLNPTWPVFEIPVVRLCGGEVDKRLSLRVFDWNKSGKSELIGEAPISVAQLQGSRPQTTWDLINFEKSRKKKGYQNSGVLVLLAVASIQQYSFLDYVAGGTHLSLAVAVDFTASNGDPNTPTSLHYRNPFAPNAYARAIRAVGTILQDYDSDHLFPAYGFGAMLPPTWAVSHCFALNGNAGDASVSGVDGILAAYLRCLEAVRLYGPTNFAPVIEAASALAASQPTAYHILLILTDGEITDMDATVRALIGASRLPLSVVIVGVGAADFTNMDALDCDGGLLRAGSVVAERDIVQFVAFDAQPTAEALAAAVLHEIPTQFLHYMRAHSIVPAPIAAAAAPPPPAAAAAGPAYGGPPPAAAAPAYGAAAAAGPAGDAPPAYSAAPGKGESSLGSYPGW